MKRIIAIIIAFAAIHIGYAQNPQLARKVLDKTAAVIGHKGGASANFKISSKQFPTTSGTITIKGKKFQASTPHAVVWFDGKTQWSYMKSTDEVNISNPTEAQQVSMNPYKFINMYKSGYTLGIKSVGNNYEVHMTAQNKQRTVQMLLITVNKATYKPSLIKMKYNNSWTTISISGFQAKNLSNSMFVFNSKDYPQAEIIDLR